MERESGCKIVIRGKGAIKDGCARHDGKPLGPEDEEPMHVLIEGCVRVGCGRSDPPTPYAARWRRSVAPLPLPHPAGPTRRASRRGRRSWRLSSTRALAPRKWLSGGLGAVAAHRLAAPSHTLPDESPPPRCLLLPFAARVLTPTRTPAGTAMTPSRRRSSRCASWRRHERARGGNMPCRAPLPEACGPTRGRSTAHSRRTTRVLTPPLGATLPPRARSSTLPAAVGRPAAP